MKRQKYIHNKDKALKKNIVFCLECGEELDMFGLSDSKIDVEKVKERFKHCKEIGKFKGDKCAMLFIADENDTAVTKDEAE